MKRGTPRHPKLSELSAALDIPKYAAAGILELLWHFAAEFALDGGIGKYSDDAIAQAVYWDGASIKLIDALVLSRWLDRCQCHRLRVHDWKDHADQTVQRVLIKRNQDFAQCYNDPSIILAPSEMPLPLPLPLPKANTFGEDPPQKTPKKPKKRSTALPEDWEPSDNHREKATKLGIDVKWETEKFRDHFHANGKKMLSWDKAFSGWLSRSYEYANGKPAAPPKPKPKPTPEEAADLKAISEYVYK